jgi:transcriptional regulator with XRE-family HTH domain
MEIPLQQLAPLLKSRRKDLKIKQEDLSETTGVALRTIRDLEKGIRKSVATYPGKGHAGFRD